MDFLDKVILTSELTLLETSLEDKLTRFKALNPKSDTQVQEGRLEALKTSILTIHRQFEENIELNNELNQIHIYHDNTRTS